jgi:large subunit ribosomal protein L20
MPRATNNVASRKRRKRILKLAKGYRGARGSLIRSASEAVDRALKFAYRDRKTRKREFRSLWIARVNAAARINNISYSKLVMGLRKAQVGLDRKMLAELAVNDPRYFPALPPWRSNRVSRSHAEFNSTNLPDVFSLFEAVK